MQTEVRSLTANGSSQPVVISTHIAPANVALGVFFSGTATGATATVQISMNNPFSDAGGQPFTSTTNTFTWVNHPTLINVTQNTLDNLAIPATMVRLTCTGMSGGTVQLRSIQAGLVT